MGASTILAFFFFFTYAACGSLREASWRSYFAMLGAGTQHRIFG
jgi:hypothetical protein